MRLARAGTLAALALLVAACDTARKVEETSAINDCTRCHGFPPADPHPQGVTVCYTCHSTSVGPGNVIIPGGTHLNGHVDVSAHPLPFPPSLHGPAAEGGASGCTECHGADYGGGAVGVSCNACHETIGYADWKTNCTFCHGTRTPGWTDANLPLAAPPLALDRTADQTSANPKVGAHQAHLVGTTYANPLTCGTCHGGIPPRTFPGSLGHVDGQPATIAFASPATQGVTPSYAGNGGSCAVYCHGTGTAFVNPTAPGPSTTVSPAWTATSIACDGCHGTPPTTGQHGFTNHQFPCGYCHLTVAGTGATPSIVNKTLHVNGQKDVALDVPGTWDGSAKTCTNVACHAVQNTRNWYP